MGSYRSTIANALNDSAYEVDSIRNASHMTQGLECCIHILSSRGIKNEVWGLISTALMVIFSEKISLAISNRLEIGLENEV